MTAASALRRGATLLLVFATVVGCDRASVAETGAETEANRLYTLLGGENASLVDMDAGFPSYSDASKNAVVERAARTFVPPPPALLLARLLMIRTPANEGVMREAFVANLRAPDAQARKASLYGLKELGTPALEEYALLSLRDEDDAVTATAIEILVPHAKRDPRLTSVLEEFHAAHQGDDRFHMSLGLLDAHGIRRNSDTRQPERP